MLARAGYRSVFVKKPLAPGMAYNPGLEDGCSIFYRVDRGRRASEDARTSHCGHTTLELLDAHSFTFAVPEEEHLAPCGAGRVWRSGDERSTIAVQNQVAVLCLFEVMSPGWKDSVPSGGDVRPRESLVIVATTHLKATKNKKVEQIRAKQVMVGSLRNSSGTPLAWSW